MRRDLFAAIALVPLVSACASTGSGVAAPTRPVTVREPAKLPPRAARLQMMPGLENVVGVDADALGRQFGQARLDVWEGDARKLQYSGQACVLDIYLYPVEGYKEPIATYVDARRASDGREVDRAACVAALRGG